MYGFRYRKVSSDHLLPLVHVRLSSNLYRHF
nr:MAG TPA: hypothetical protein [Caudoviricetes sp.]